MTSLAKGPLFIANGGPYSALPMSIVFYYFTLTHLCQGNNHFGGGPTITEGCNFVYWPAPAGYPAVTARRDRFPT